MNGFLILFTILCSVVIIGLIITLYKLSQKSDDDDILEGNYCINLMSGICGGRALGIETDVKLGKDGRQIIKYFPTDVDHKKIEDAKEILCVVGKNKRIVLPKGDFSRDKNIVVYLPPTLTELPESLKKLLGEKMKQIEIMNAITTELAAVREGSNRKSASLERLGDGELSSAEMTKSTELALDMKNIVGDNKKKDGFTPGTSP